MTQPPLEPRPRSLLGAVFLIAFLDLVGFSILFPLLPAMLQHYLELEGADSAIGRLVDWLHGVTGHGESADIAVAALFGGLLGSLYSFLQFACAPLWGVLSDRYGRRPILLLTLAGTAAGYALWVFAGSFAVLVLSRLLGGAMAGNLSTASAVVGDVTTPADRARGMGMIGMAVGLGFIAGPVLGGLASGLDLTGGTPPTGAALALNPFSGAALTALALSILNLVWVARRLPETLPPERRAAPPTEPRAGPSHHPFRVLQRLNLPGVHRATFTYFAYVLAFSAMEFTLTFLAAERFDFSPRGNAVMFVYVGLMLALVQGGLVRRLAPRLGERRLAAAGLVLTIPGLILVALATHVALLYAGLTFLALGSGCAMPALSALVSLYTPPDRQGLALGAFRSAGALARALGPLLGAILYWRLGSAAPYHAAAAFLVLPLLLSRRLPAVGEAVGGGVAS